LTRCFDASAPGHTNLLRLPPAQRAESQTLMERLAAESEGAQAAAYGSDVVARACLLQLLAGLNRFALAAPARHEVEDKAGPVVAEVLHYINEHYPDELSLDLLSAKFFISKYHLSHEFHRLVGTSVYRYIIQKRLVIAKQMLANGVAPRTYTAIAAWGLRQFLRAFKAEYHISPETVSGRAGMKIHWRLTQNVYCDKTTQGAYTAYVLADTGAGTTATVVPEKGGMVTTSPKTEMNIPGCGSRTSLSRSARAAPCRAVSHVRARAAGREHLRRQKLSYDHPRHRPLHALAGGGDGETDGASSPCASRTTPKRGKAILLRQRYHPVCAQGRRAAL
jgi:AraC-like DNA-binding protein